MKRHLTALVFLLSSISAYCQCDTAKLGKQPVVVAKTQKDKVVMIMLIRTLSKKQTENMLLHFNGFLEDLKGGFSSDNKRLLNQRLDSVINSAETLIDFLNKSKPSAETKQLRRFAYVFSCRLSFLSSKYKSVISNTSPSEIKSEFRKFETDFDNALNQWRLYEKEFLALKKRYELDKYTFSN